MNKEQVEYIIELLDGNVIQVYDEQKEEKVYGVLITETELETLQEELIEIIQSNKKIIKDLIEMELLQESNFDDEEYISISINNVNYEIILKFKEKSNSVIMY